MAGGLLLVSVTRDSLWQSNLEYAAAAKKCDNAKV
jgi:hypothetical protein